MPINILRVEHFRYDRELVCFYKKRIAISIQIN